MSTTPEEDTKPFTCPNCGSTKFSMCFGYKGHGIRCQGCEAWISRETYEKKDTEPKAAP